MKKLILLWLCLFTLQAFAKIDTPVHWKFASTKLDQNKYAVSFTADIDKGWHLYSQFLKSGGPVPTTFKFDKTSGLALVDKVTEKPEALSGFDQSFQMIIRYHEHQVMFTQIVYTKDPAAHLTGSLNYMVCSGQKCLPPSDVSFDIPVNSTVVQQPGSHSVQANHIGQHTLKSPSVKAPSNSDHALLAIFLAGFVGGLAAFFLPCIYPMVPLTVSFFTKRSGTRSQGIKTAVIYGLSIIAIYVGLGLLITAIFGASALNEAASSAAFNLLFFVILVVFALSFLGAFEITLPSFFVNKMDQKSEGGGWIGLFFMAFTLALVSFSCTGPLIGTLLVEAVSKGTYLGPALGMFGFSLALALPFTAFAIFPSWLKALPKSGGWLNSVKIVLGLLELALAFKYLTNVDLAYHWGLLSRDLFLVIWIIIFGVLAFYLLGKIRLSHDTEVTSIPLFRLLLAMVTLVFTLYLVPGLFGAPLKGISGWLPPQSTQQFALTGSGNAPGTAPSTGHKYAGLFHAPDNIDAFYDYEEGLAYAKKINKPVLLDFTGWSCTNCRKMEASVWSDPEVLKRIKNDYVLISLYVDDRTALSESEKYTSKVSAKAINTLGQKWSDLQEAQYNTNAQPFYVVLAPDGKPAAEPRAFDLDIKAYTNFLDQGINAAKRTSSTQNFN
ncbi:protein-disulfide reductase DsbD family protein [Mucilaginibacter aquariorum]|uniref:Thioredoxin family protein n=1 Tax=Mucilaginibacter aquariorum TaxID=2967225 RepID=A0ABT1T943_9SPHI|nr:cytochrome c biogenesis protein CcdA [Mucilaginibacter aquariorum]MCQ6961139.1 thioredoxin family protein [Mucilaginibacter aquariorum]